MIARSACVLAADALATALSWLLRALRPFAIVRRLVLLARLRAQVKGAIPCTTQFDGPVSALGTGDVVLGPHCRLGSGVQIETSQTGQVRVGARVRINTGCLIAANHVIAIGDDTLIGEYVSIRDSNHGIAPGELIRTQPEVGRSISIGRDVWIGRGSCILSGVSIGDGAVVGANSVVTKDVAPGTIWVGVAAREIRRRSPPA